MQIQMPPVSGVIYVFVTAALWCSLSCHKKRVPDQQVHKILNAVRTDVRHQGDSLSARIRAIGPAAFDSCMFEFDAVACDATETSSWTRARALECVVLFGGKRVDEFLLNVARCTCDAAASVAAADELVTRHGRSSRVADILMRDFNATSDELLRDKIVSIFRQMDDRNIVSALENGLATTREERVRSSLALTIEALRASPRCKLRFESKLSAGNLCNYWCAGPVESVEVMSDACPAYVDRPPAPKAAELIAVE